MQEQQRLSDHGRHRIDVRCLGGLRGPPKETSKHLHQDSGPPEVLGKEPVIRVRLRAGLRQNTPRLESSASQDRD